MIGHLLPPCWVLLAPLGLVVEVCGEESDRDEASGGWCVATEVGASVLGKPLCEVYAPHKRLLYSPFVEVGATSVLFEEVGWEVWGDLVLPDEGVVDNLEHVKNVGLLGGEGRILRSEGDDREVEPER